jgi:hypothetical protein
VRVFISPGIVVLFGPFWTPGPAPYAYPYRYHYAYPPVVVQQLCLKSRFCMRFITFFCAIKYQFRLSFDF